MGAGNLRSTANGITSLSHWMVLRVWNLSALCVCIWVVGQLPVRGIHRESVNRTRDFGLADKIHIAVDFSDESCC